MDVERFSEQIATLYEERSEPLTLDEVVARRRSVDAALRARPWSGLLVAALAGVAGIVVFALPAWIGREPAEVPETRAPVATTAPPVVTSPPGTPPQLPRTVPQLAGLRGWVSVDLPRRMAGGSPVMVWTGSELVLWGGEDADGLRAGEPGAAYRPDSATWRNIAPAPLPATFGAAGVWTGTEMVVCCGSGSSDAAAYDPVTDSWRSLPDAPLPAAQDEYAEAVWTGSAVLVVNGRGVAGYDPPSDTWRTFAEPPEALGRLNEVAWTGDLLVVWPTEVSRGEYPGMALDPASGTWRLLPDPELWPEAPDVVWTGDELIVWGSPAKGSRLDLGADAWTVMSPAVPTPDSCECNWGSQSTVWTGTDLIVSTGYLGTGVDKNAPLLLAYEPNVDQWTLVGESPVGWGAEAMVAGDRVVFRSDRLYISEPGWTPQGPVVTADTIGGFDVTYRIPGPSRYDSPIDVTYPISWYRAGEDLTPNAGVSYRFGLGTYPLRTGGSRCAHMPVNAMEDLGPNDVFLFLEERGPIASSVGWEPRPATFAGWLTGIDEGTDAWECMRDDERGNIGALRWIPFEDGGHGLYLLAVIGTDASDEDVATAVRILDSLVVEEPLRR
ncbi:MAG TPA: hypothetical protein VGC11_14590 [Acidimicrobiia bacterium]